MSSSTVMQTAKLSVTNVIQLENVACSVLLVYSNKTKLCLKPNLTHYHKRVMPVIMLVVEGWL